MEGHRPPPQEGGGGDPRRDPPPLTPPPTPHWPAGHGDAGPPPPPRQRGRPPPPGRTAASGRGAAAGPASTPPAACSRRNRDGHANQRRHTRAPGDAPADRKRARTGAVLGPRPPWPEQSQRHPLCCLPREGRGTNKGKATPRPTGPPGRTVRGYGAQAAPPPPRTPQRRNAPDTQTHPTGSAQPQAR